MSNWITHPKTYGAAVIPLNDLIWHEDNGTCVCGPTWKPILIPGGPTQRMLVHHSLDNREQQETP